MKLCQACMGEPKGIEGHPGLRVDVYHDSKAAKPLTAFVCEACRAIWRRTYTGDGKFEWQRFELPGDKPASR